MKNRNTNWFPILVACCLLVAFVYRSRAISRAAGPATLSSPAAGMNMPQRIDEESGQQVQSHKKAQQLQADRLALERKVAALLQMQRKKPVQRQTAKARLRKIVEDAFENRQQLQRWQLRQLQEQLLRIEKSLSSRQRNKDKIIEQRVEQLLGSPAARHSKILPDSDSKGLPKRTSVDSFFSYSFEWRPRATLKVTIPKPKPDEFEIELSLKTFSMREMGGFVTRISAPESLTIEHISSSAGPGALGLGDRPVAKTGSVKMRARVAPASQLGAVLLHLGRHVSVGEFRVELGKWHKPGEPIVWTDILEVTGHAVKAGFPDVVIEGVHYRVDESKKRSARKAPKSIELNKNLRSTGQNSPNSRESRRWHAPWGEEQPSLASMATAVAALTKAGLHEWQIVRNRLQIPYAKRKEYMDILAEVLQLESSLRRLPEHVLRLRKNVPADITLQGVIKRFPHLKESIKIDPATHSIRFRGDKGTLQKLRQAMPAVFAN